ncbi:PREDICTED: late embryogenesis abundant protein Lea5 [Tarenaya hassleriana]|uniref:late embryogenesis abundant protein Lea5 n=1 Tax=Tarenaya hassleriana TaxID=28532 RepID=UPI00053C90E6|nr:PREDICTED: late embryogenesis abundant protein Lea5 [Tarenaya hassleriana]
MAARSISGAVKPVFSAVSGGISVSAVFRRGYVAAPQGVPSGGLSKGGSTGAMVGKQLEQSAVRDEEAENAWAPDPITGYYRPANRAAEIDPAELREMLLKHKSKPF